MTGISKNICAWGTVISAICVAAISFPNIAKTAENQRLNAQSKARFETLEAYASKDSMDDVVYWLESDKTALKAENTASDQALHENLNLAAQSKCMAQAVYYEARSETRSGQRAVAEVVLNRVKSKHFPNTICEVIFEGSERSTGCQFSFTCDGSMDIAPRGKGWVNSVKVANYVMSGGHSPITNWSTHYHTLTVKPKWSGTMRMTRQVGSHVFYRFAPKDYKPSEPAILVAPPI